jgi:hypothetical protein
LAFSPSLSSVFLAHQSDELAKYGRQVEIRLRTVTNNESNC